MHPAVTCSHRLVLPSDTQHHGTLYAGALLRLALEAAYATAHRTVGSQANLVLRRVHNVECKVPVPVGTVLELQGTPLHIAHSYMVVGLVGTPLAASQPPWMEGLLGFAQIDAQGRPTAFPSELQVANDLDDYWDPLKTRLEKLIKIR